MTIVESQQKFRWRIRDILLYIGENPDREGLVCTPDRVLRSYDELFSGYKQDPTELFTCFEDGACDEMVILKGLEFYSTCEHHLLPFFGVAHIAYIPDGKVIGISKLARLLDCFARRLQVQERLTTQITECIQENLQPLGSACVIEAKHLCMMCRGVRKQDSTMITSCLIGAFRTNSTARQELLQLIRG